MERNLGEELRDDSQSGREPMRRELDETNQNDSEGIEDLGAGLSGGRRGSPGLGAGGGIGSDMNTGNSGRAGISEDEDDPDLENETPR